MQNNSNQEKKSTDALPTLLREVSAFMGETLKKGDVLPFLKQLIKVVQDKEAKILDNINSFKSSIKQEVASYKNEMSVGHKEMLSDMEKMHSMHKSEIEGEIRALKNRLAEVNNELSEIPDLLDYSDIFEDISEKLTKLELLTLGENVRNSLEVLPEGDKLSIEAIEGLRKELQDIRQIRSTGSGVTDMRIRQAFKYILNTEQPTGAINGSNTVYTVKNPIFAVLAFSLNGETIAQLPNYTVSGRTITFSTALPSAYSGKDFEIKYIG